MKKKVKNSSDIDNIINAILDYQYRREDFTTPKTITDILNDLSIELKPHEFRHLYKKILSLPYFESIKVRGRVYFEDCILDISSEGYTLINEYGSYNEYLKSLKSLKNLIIKDAKGSWYGAIFTFFSFIIALVAIILPYTCTNDKIDNTLNDSLRVVNEKNQLLQEKLKQNARKLVEYNEKKMER